MTRVINATMAATAIASNTPIATAGPSIVNGTERNMNTLDLTLWIIQ